ncbi:Superfamily II DNA or RNA helicase [Sphingobium sp. YR768]|nr:Superfamily II DNA or RNA helicase [Sphingobium sp. YR768]
MPAASLVDILSPVEPFYILPKDDVAELVISPALQACMSADVMIGYFASQSLAEIAPGLAAYLRSSTQPLRLIVSPFLTAQDQDALRLGTLGSEELAALRLEAALPDADALARHSLECLAWLISAGRLQMKIALMRNALFHPKAWIFTDGRDEAVLHGSANMTGAGLGRNREQLSLARNWMGSDAARTCVRLKEEFALLWGGGDSDCIVVDLPRAFQEKLLQDYKTDRMPSEAEFLSLWRRGHGLPGEPVPGPQTETPAFTIPDWLQYRAGDYAHQGDAVDAWEAAERRGILEMCTGSGKTLTAMVAAQRLYASEGPQLIVVTAPYNVLIEQWCREIALFGLNPVNLSHENGAAGRERAMANARRRLRMGLSPTEVIVVSNDTLCTPEFIVQVERFECTKLLIADECHNLGAPAFIRNPPETFQYRLGLSATPMRQYDDDGSAALIGFFGPVCFSFRLEDAIGRCLTPYDYFVHFVPLADLEMAEWRDLSDQISRLAWKFDAGVKDDHLNNLLLKRRRVLETAQSKLIRLGELIDTEDVRDLRHTLVYTTDKDPVQLDAVNSLLNARHILFHQLTSEESSNPEMSRRILDRFKSGDLQILTAKRVLDEGVNVPEIQRAYLLASTTVRRQWVQRRGRLLRICKEIGKTHAIIHDLVALPPEAYDGSALDSEAKKIVSAELDRVWEFARLSRNAAQNGGPFAQVEELRAMLKGRD